MKLVLLCLALTLVPAAALAAGLPAGTADGPSRLVPARLAATLRQGSNLGATADDQSLAPADLAERGRREHDPTCPSSPHMDTDLWGTDGTVNAIVREGMTVYIGGTFTSVSATTGSGVPLGRASGRVLQHFPKVQGEVDAAIPDDHGGWFIGGTFVAVDGQPRRSLAHIRGDGHVAPWRTDADPYVFALALKGDTLYVGGRFFYVGGQSRHCLAAIDARTGAVFSWAPDPNDEVFALAVQGNTLYVGGNFYDIGGRHQPYLAAVDATTGLFTNWNPSPNGFVEAIAASDSTVYAGGSFAQVAGQSRNRVVAVDARTGALRNWSPNPNGVVSSLALTGRTVFAQGGFSSMDGQARNGAAAVDAVTGAVLPWAPDTSLGRITTLAIRGRTVYAGWVQPTSRPYGIATLDLETGAARGWQAVTNGYVNVLALAGDVLYSGGGFSTVGPSTQRSNLAAVDAVTGEVTPWNPGVVGVGVNALAVAGHLVYVGGDFSRIGGQPRTNLAAVDARGGRASALDLSTDGTVEALETRDRALYVGGGFTRMGNATRRNLAALDWRSRTVTSWNPSPNGPVHSLAAEGGKVYVGGSFDRIGGGSGEVPRSNLAAVDAETGVVAPWDPNPSGYVTALALRGNTIYVGGVFRTVGGQPRDALAAVEGSTGATLPWNPNAEWLGAHAVPRHALAILDSTVYVSGRFAWIGGSPRSGFAALNARDAQATCWDPGRCFVVKDIVPYGNTIYAGGFFVQMGGYPMNSLAAFSVPKEGTERRVFATAEENVAATPSPLSFAVSNPARGTGEVRFSLPAAAAVNIAVFDLQGRRVASVLERAWLGAGYHLVAIPTEGWRVGLYLCRLTTNNAMSTTKFVVVR
jgi:hypothetical protein